MWIVVLKDGTEIAEYEMLNQGKDWSALDETKIETLKMNLGPTEVSINRPDDTHKFIQFKTASGPIGNLKVRSQSIGLCDKNGKCIIIRGHLSGRGFDLIIKDAVIKNG